MKQYQLLQASSLLRNLSTYKLPIKSAYSIYVLLKKADECRDFFIGEEKKLIKEYNGTLLENGQIKFETVEFAQQFQEKHNELKSLEIDAAPAFISLSAFDTQTFSAQEIALLDGIVEFID